MRLLIVDDHEVVRRGVRSLLLEQSEFEVCGEAIDGQDALEQACELKPDLILMDVSMPRLNGLEATRQVRTMLPDCEVLILSQHENPEMARQALKAGARGYVVKGSISKDLISAVRKVSRRECFFDPAILDQTPSAHTDLQEILKRSAGLEEALRQSEQLYRSTFELAAVGVAHVSPDGRWLRVNRKLCEIVGYNEAELLRLTFQDITHPDDLATDLAQTEKVRSGELDTYSLEKRYIRKDGSLVWINLTVSGVHDASGKFDHFISVIEDISKRRQVEEALQHSQKDLALALESSRTAMFDWDVIQKCGEWNSQMTAIYDFRPKNEYISAEEWMSLFHPEDRSRLVHEAEQVWKEGDEFTFEFRTVRRDGEIRWVLSHGRIVRDEAGKAIRMIGTHTDITNRKRIEIALQQRQSELNEAQRLAKIGSWHWIPKTDTVTWSEELYRIAGRDPKSPAVSYHDHYTLYTPESWSRLQEAVSETLKNGTGYSVELELVRPDGTKRWVVANAEGERDLQGGVASLRGTVQDITDRKRIEEATGLLSAIVASSEDAIISKTLDGIITSWNAGAERLFGYSAEEAIGQHITLVIPEERQSEEADILDRLRRGQPVDHFHTIRRRKDGALLDVSLSISPVRDSSGQVIGASKVARDITSQKRAERELRESEQRFRVITDASPIMVWMSGTDKLCYYFNKGWLDFVGRTLEQELGNGWAENLHSEDFDRCLQIYVSNFDARRPFEMEYRMRHHTGQYRWILDRGVPRYSADGKFEGYVGGCLDIHYQKEAAEKVRIADDMTRLLKAQDHERRRIARELHDSAGQTLTVLGLSLAQLVERAQVVAPELAKEGKEIEGVVQQLHREIRTTSYLLHPPLLDECGLASALNLYVEGLAERSDVAITLDVADNVRRLPSDIELAIFRFVQECLTNIHRHSGSKTADIRMFVDAESLHVEVSDRGKGIPPERLAEIRSGGSGVGIRGMQERLRQFGGEMTIDATGSGTRVLAAVPIPKGINPTDDESAHIASEVSELKLVKQS